MAQMLVVKEHLKVFYGKYEVYIKPVLKFLLALIVFMIINRDIGYMEKLDSPVVVLVASLLCSFLPLNMVIVFAAIFIVLHVYTLSIECAAVVLILFLLMFLLYFRFSPKDTLGVLLTPVAFVLRIPYVMPLAYGYEGSPLSAVSVSCGVIVYYVLKYVKDNSTLLGNMDSETTVARFKVIVDSLLKNRIMIVMVAAFAITLIAVYIIKRLSVNHSWTIALVTGVILDMMIIIAADSAMNLGISVPGLLLGSLVSAAIALILQFFVFSVDYTRTEYVQFEDDEYYYYVKAVPKTMVKLPEKKVTKINPSRSQSGQAERTGHRETEHNYSNHKKDK